MNRSTPTADQLFQAQLAQRGLQHAINSDGLYEIVIGDVKVTVNLENVRRNYERDKDPDAITQFAKQLNTDLFGDIPSWADVKPLIRFSLEPSDYTNGFSDTIHETVNDDLIKVFVYIPEDGSRISWITNDMIAVWQITQDAVVALANKNMDLIISETKVDTQDIDGVSLGMLSTKETPFKASLIVSSQFRKLVSPTHGWPVYVVAPARDFVYIIPKVNRDFLGRLGPVVLREYNASGHPITQDVLEVGDNGVIAIGSFAQKDGSHQLHRGRLPRGF